LTNLLIYSWLVNTVTNEQLGAGGLAQHSMRNHQSFLTRALRSTSGYCNWGLWVFF